MLHDLSAYDLHLILENLPKSSKQANLSCLGPSSKRLLTFSYKAFKFIDSCNFLKISLATLCSNLAQAGVKKFMHTHRHFESEEQFSLMLEKGVYLYAYMTSFARFEEEQLPPKSAFFNDLTDSDITDEDHENAVKVWNAFNCKTLQDYYDVYLSSDVTQLVDVFVCFADMAFSDYGLDVKNTFDCPHTLMTQCWRRRVWR